VALIEFVTEEPAMTDLSPELASEKLNGWVIVNEALVSALGLYPILNAFAFRLALLVRVTVPV
jgi:hypothetical protein